MKVLVLKSLACFQYKILVPVSFVIFHHYDKKLNSKNSCLSYLQFLFNIFSHCFLIGFGLVLDWFW